jgi:hypothetical protein
VAEQHVLDFFAWLWGSYWDPVWTFVRPVWPGVWTLAKIVVIAVPLILSVAYLTLAERKVIGWMQVRIGPIAWGRSVCCSRSPTSSSCCSRK